MLAVAPSPASERRWAVRTVLLVLLMAIAAGVRVYRLGTPPLDFHPTRQLRSALLARSIYLAASPAVQPWRLEVIRAATPPLYEPPVLEYLAAQLYHLTGETLAVPRLLSATAWLAGGLLLFSLARRYGGDAGAFAALAFYLFLPFAVEASRSIQPDPLMVALIIAAALAMLRFSERHTLARLLAFALAAGAATLVKPMAIPVVVAGTMGVALWQRHVSHKARLAWGLAAAMLVSLLPAAWYYGRDLLSGGTMSPYAGQIFMPRLLLSFFFWRGWPAQIWKVVGLVPFVIAALGSLHAPKGAPRWLLGGLWCGYAVYALAFSYPAATHDYYHLQLVPIVALGVAAAVGWARDAVEPALERASGLVRTLPALLLVVASADAATVSYYRFRSREFSAQVATYREVGEAVNHSTRLIALTDYYGYPLAYYGEVALHPWPHGYDFRAEDLQGLPRTAVEQRLARINQREGCDTFVVTDLPEFASQPELRAYLETHAGVAARTDHYLVFSIRHLKN
jgi:4-amino-4-deoxy-L-arabinose transferase-like glycosyltransferase